MEPPEPLLGHDAIRRLADLSAERDDLVVSVVEPSDGTILWCSEPGLRRLAQREPDEVVGKPTCVLVPPRDWAHWNRTRADAARGHTIAVTGEIERPDGRCIRVWGAAWRVDGDTGPVVAVSVKDPTERRR